MKDIIMMAMFCGTIVVIALLVFIYMIWKGGEE